MRKFRRLCHRLRVSRKAKDPANCSANGEPGNRVPQAVEPTVTEPILATEQCGEDTAKAIWLDAYRKLQEEGETKKMIETYEIILMNQLDGAWIIIVSFTAYESQPGYGAETESANQAVWVRMMRMLRMVSRVSESRKRRFPTCEE